MDRNLTAIKWQFLAKVVISVTLALADAHLAGAADQALIARARRILYTNRDGSLAILEDVVRHNPEEVAYWIEYIHALDVDGYTSFADRASRHALKVHPHDPDLLIARGRLRRDGVGVEVLDELAKVPRYQAKAERRKDLLTCCLSAPESEPWPSETFVALADRLLVLGRADAAKRYVDEGLKTVGGERARPLLARRAMLAALNGEFDRAMRLHTSAGGAQVMMKDSYHGLADVLLIMNKPDLAMTSFGRQLPVDGDSRRLLAIAKLRSNDADGALRSLAGVELEDRLLRCRALLSAGRADTAKTLGREIVAPMEIEQGSYFGPWIGAWSGPRALVDDYLAVVRWLNDQFPDRRPGIEFKLGRGTEKLPIRPRGWSPVEPISRTIARLEAAIRKPTNAEVLESLRTELSYAYAQAGRYDDAAKSLTTCPPTYASGTIRYEWVQYSMLRRQAEALAVSEKDYASLAAARPIIANVRASRWNRPKVNGQPWLSDAEVVRRLVAIGPAVLADVMTQLGPNTISGADRRPWVAVIERLGSARDAPVLIATLALVTRPEHHPHPRQDENDRLTATAIETCLERLTRAKPEGRDRAIAWTKWWAGKVTQIMAGR